MSHQPQYHFPPPCLVKELIADKNLGQPYDHTLYSFLPYRPNYLVLGTFGKWTNVYAVDLQKEPCVSVYAVGDYELLACHPSAVKP